MVICRPEPSHPGKGFYLPTDRQSWSVDPDICAVDEQWMEALDDVSRRWKFLAPYFAGLRLLPLSRASSPIHDTLRGWPSAFTTRAGVSVLSPRRPLDRQGFRIYPYPACRVFASGLHEINWDGKLVSFPGEESDELKIYRLLNTPQARKDPRNHTVPVIDWIEYSGLIFIVSPRWGDPIIGMVPLSADQLLHYADTLLEGLVFLHENRVAHRDIHVGNTVLDIITGYHRRDALPLLHPSLSRFAYIDFDASVVLPIDTAIDSVLMEREMRLGVGWLRLPQAKSNPFNDDVVVLLHALQTYTRVLESEIPEIGLFFDKYLGDLVAPPSAAVVLAAFRNLRSTLTREQLDHVPKRTVWKPAKAKTA
ncbi:other/AgaK1 protein kinase [Coprinopsis sp. MPI-PUGE-AT-0042]|nr:other/AgaK1 protein kinase [Coprinopsis sp. MPI-PUGE-AT-0042]